ncbi:Uncharacterised protein [Mycobacteroides abscessus]|nr:Uncharacterised protein [Mycobacteroides abscessus]
MTKSTHTRIVTSTDTTPSTIAAMEKPLPDRPRFACDSPTKPSTTPAMPMTAAKMLTNGIQLPRKPRIASTKPTIAIVGVDDAGAVYGA